ncbi:hypothetical protein [Chengkuizengella sediminis]|uniref:hypothetical protein n=1 Tax=Chengkuizengella sediminis TaxID=1885917 RepID=UPI0013896A49|nr:hypothetical protein [Chengkuizengella sediminis]NDI33610.1 hypothetical protein [Chengkuizengella sediminis]
MGVFDESKCDCCICPMQCVLEQLIDETLSIVTLSDGNLVEVTINEVKDFLLFTSKGTFPICQITVLFIEENASKLPKLKPIRKSTGECACCEDPITNLLNNTFKGQVVDIKVRPNNNIINAPVFEVGEGIVNINNRIYISTCAITTVTPK